MMPGIHPNGLFWTTVIHPRAFRHNTAGTRAELRLRGLPLTDSVFYGGFDIMSSIADVNVIWRASGPPVARGLGTSGDETAFTRWSGELAPARCSGRARGSRTGQWFETGRMTDATFATIGYERNGVFL